MESPQVLTKSSPDAEMVAAPSAEARRANAAPLAWVLLPALASALLCWLSHYPVGWGWLAWVALVPLLCLVRTPARAWKVYPAAWLGGLAFFGPALYWFHYADNPQMDIAGGALAVCCSLFWPLGVFLLRRLDRRTALPLVVAVPAVWVALEYFRAHVGTGFPWYFLSHTQHARLVLIQVADLGGAYAVTFLVAAVNAAVFEWLCTRQRFRSFFRLPEPSHNVRLQVGAVALLAVIVCAYGLFRLWGEDFAPGPRVALIQGNIEQRVRNEASLEKEREALVGGMLEQYRALNDRAAQERPALVVWPETSFPNEWWELEADFSPDKLSPDMRGALARVLNRPDWRSLAPFLLNKDILEYFFRWPGREFLIGINSRIMADGDADHGRHYNSAVLLRPGPEPFQPRRYDKMHRVPFGEYIPFEDSLPWMNALSPYGEGVKYGVLPGDSYTRFPVGDYRFGVLICFEDTDPYLARQYVRPTADGEPGVDFLVNISNDGWFDGSWEHDEHLAVCRFRAVECRRSIGRSVNMGISAVIDGSGRVVALPGKDWPGSKKMSGVVTADIPLDRRYSLYAAWGDWLPVLCWLGLGVGLAGSFVRPRRGA
jgi:apolipoprotein N-acyltransferase